MNESAPAGAVGGGGGCAVGGEHPQQHRPGGVGLPVPGVSEDRPPGGGGAGPQVRHQGTPPSGS